MVTFISAAGTTSESGITNEILFLCSSFASPIDSVLNAHCLEHCQCFLKPRQDSMPYEWTMPAFPAMTGQFFKEVSLILTLRDLSLLFSQGRKAGTSGTLGDFSTSEFHLRRFSTLYVFYFHPSLLEVFTLLVFLWTSYATLTFLLDMLSLFPGKPHSSPSSKSKPANCSSFSKSQSSLMKTFLMPSSSFRCSFSVLTFL